MTVVPHGELGYLTAWPTGSAQPIVSTLNSIDGTVLANAAIVPAANDGSVSFFATNDTDLVVDVNGYFAPPGTNGLNFNTLAPMSHSGYAQPCGALWRSRIYAGPDTGLRYSNGFLRNSGHGAGLRFQLNGCPVRSLGLPHGVARRTDAASGCPRSMRQKH